MKWLKILMRQFINEPLSEQRLVFEAVGQRMKMLPAIIEKDFWVVFLLDYLFNDFEYQEYLCFKGGTSLSKAYNLIERFSEDIDLAIDWTLLGYMQSEPYEYTSKTKMSKFVKEVHPKAEQLIKTSFLPLIKKDLESILKYDFKLELDKEDLQTILFSYPRQYEDSSILQVIRIEFGALAEKLPSESKVIEPYISQTNPGLLEKKQASIIVLSPIRTLFEKLLILHRECLREKTISYERYSRHYYDVYQIINGVLQDEIFSSLDILYATIDFNIRFYPYSWANYDEICEGKIRLVPPQEKLEELEKDYKRMDAMIFGYVPNFREIIDDLKVFEVLLNDKLSVIK